MEQRRVSWHEPLQSPGWEQRTQGRGVSVAEEEGVWLDELLLRNKQELRELRMRLPREAGEERWEVESEEDEALFVDDRET